MNKTVQLEPINEFNALFQAVNYDMPPEISELEWESSVFTS